MTYGEFFKSLREAKGVTAYRLAQLSGLHRNTIVNIERCRPPRLRTVIELMGTMGYAVDSQEVRTVALLWMRSKTGLSFLHPDSQEVAHQFIERRRAATQELAQELRELVDRVGLSSEQIEGMAFAVARPAVLDVLKGVREAATRIGPNHVRKIPENA